MSEGGPPLDGGDEREGHQEGTVRFGNPAAAARSSSIIPGSAVVARRPNPRPGALRPRREGVSRRRRQAL
jgi:hypothetical protein